MDKLQPFIVHKGYVLALIFVVFFIAERLRPKASNLHSLTQLGRNAGLAAINFVLSPLIVIPLTAAVASTAPQWRPDYWSGWGGLIIDLLLLDFWIYWWHRLNHVVPFLWRWHEVHHLDETLDTTSAVRFHFGEVILSALVRAAVIWLLAVPLGSVVVFEVLVTACAIFHHSNFRMPVNAERLLAFIMVTPSIHWVHHHARRTDTDSNYSTVLSMWDRLFASASKTVRSESMAIGVEGRRDSRLVTLMLLPFR